MLIHPERNPEGRWVSIDKYCIGAGHNIYIISSYVLVRYGIKEYSDFRCHV